MPEFEIMPAKPVFKPKPNAIVELFGRRQAVIGVIHSLPLPGSPGYQGDDFESWWRSPAPRPNATVPAGSTG